MSLIYRGKCYLTLGFALYKIKFRELVSSLGYKKYFKIYKKNELKFVLKKFLKSKGPSFLEVAISKGSMQNLMRPKDLIKIKNNFLKNI